MKVVSERKGNRRSVDSSAKAAFAQDDKRKVAGIEL